MFEKARIKLTLYYLLLIMLISLFFSAIIYRGVAFELQRGLHRIENRLKLEEQGFKFPHQPPAFIGENLEVVRERVLHQLIKINFFILVAAGLAGYFLAGKTLAPIKKALEEQKRFVADASHELKTPLTAQKASIEVALRNKKLSLSQAKKVFKNNLEEIGNLQFLTEGLLVLAQTQQANGSNFRAVDLAKIINQVMKKIIPLAKKKKIGLEKDLEKVLIKGDKTSLEKMLLIFVDNGIKYSQKKGRVKISLYQEKNKAVIKIKDQGIGISKKDLTHIFKRFYRADKSRAKDGFGLGLAIAKKIIDLHQGSVKVESEAKKGTTFTISLPF